MQNQEVASNKIFISRAPTFTLNDFLLQMHKPYYKPISIYLVHNFNDKKRIYLNKTVYNARQMNALS